MLLLSVSFSYTHAGDEYYEKDETSKEMEDREVIYYDFDLELELENGIVEAEWDEFEGEGFDWYKLVYSTTNSKPLYPTDKTVFVGSEDQTQASFKLKGGYENHYVRICAITLNDDYSKDRYCGEAQKLEWDGEYEREEKEEKKYVQKKVSTQQALQKKYKENKIELSSEIKSRVDTIIENFISKLEDKGYSDDKIVSTIDAVISRLGSYKNKEKYAAIVSYMIVVLEEYMSEYEDTLWDLEEIFSEF